MSTAESGVNRATAPTVLITGSSRGLGRSLARTFASHGFRLILHGRDRSALSEARTAIAPCGVDCDMVCGDLTSRKTIDDLYDAADGRSLDVLIHNAGVYRNELLADLDPSEFRRLIDVNLMAPVVLTKKLWPLFKRQRYGLIININSMAGHMGADGEGAYSASKHGLRGFARSFRFEANRDGVRVTDVYLGTMNTAMVEGRRDPAKCIRTDEAADVIWRLSTEYVSLRVDEIHLNRRLY